MQENSVRNPIIDLPIYYRASKAFRPLRQELIKERGEKGMLQKMKSELEVRRNIRGVILSELTQDPEEQSKFKAAISEPVYNKAVEKIRVIKEGAYLTGDPTIKEDFWMAARVMGRVMEPKFLFPKKQKEQLLTIAGFPPETNKGLWTSFWFLGPQTAASQILPYLSGLTTTLTIPIFDAKQAIFLTLLSSISMIVNAAVNYFMQKKINTTDSFQYTAGHIMAERIFRSKRLKRTKVFLFATALDTGIGLASNVFQLAALLIPSAHASSFVTGKAITDILFRVIKMPIKGVWIFSPEIKNVFLKKKNNSKIVDAEN